MLLNLANSRGFSQPESPTDNDQNQKLLSRGDFCRILKRQILARLFISVNCDRSLSLLNKTQVLERILQPGPGETLKNVLRNYHLTAKDKVMLSYAIAQSYWRYYDSELMRTKWNSDTICFMPERESREHEGRLPLCAYLSLPFGTPGNMTPDIIHEGRLKHRCPRIFDIGILLLEIGLAKPFRSGNRRDMVAQANLNHKTATNELLELEKVRWDGFTNKVYFDRVVKFCLNSENFIPPIRRLNPFETSRFPSWPTTTALDPRVNLIETSVRLPGRPTTSLDPRAGIRIRRKILFKNVVLPLAWLAQRSFKAQDGDITYANKKPNPLP